MSLKRNSDQKYKTYPGTVLTSSCGSYYLITSENTTCINETAAFIWKQLEKGADETELYEAVKNSYEIEDVNLLNNDIHTLIEFLFNHHLIKRYSE